MNCLFRFAWFLVLGFGMQASEVVQLGSRLELFVDYHPVEKLDGARLKLHEPQLAGEVLRFDRPWEGRFSGYVTVLKDGDLFRMYYRGLGKDAADGSTNEFTCYAQSHDGISWEKRNLGLYEVFG